MKIDLEDALATLEDMRHEDSEEGVANALFRVGVAYLERSRVSEADEALDEAYYYCKKLENPSGLARICLRWAEVALLQEQVQLAEERLSEALAVFEKENDQTGVVGALERLGRVCAHAGRDEEACAHFERALNICAKGGDQVGQLLFSQYTAPLLRRRGLLKEAAKSYASMGDLARAKGDHMREALAWVGVGTCRAEAGDIEGGVANLGQAKKIFTSLGQLSRAEQVQSEIERFSAIKT